MSKWKTTDEAIATLIDIEKQEKGYLEKKDGTAKYLDDKTANAGYNNYAKYWRDLNKEGCFNYGSSWCGGPDWFWCAGFQFWCFMKAFGKEASKKLLLHSPYIACQTLATKSKAAGLLKSTPQVGDVVLFYNGSRYSHTGLVIAVDTKAKTFKSMEGNTSNASGVVANGGGVAQKSYTYGSDKYRFHRPEYAKVLGLENGNAAKAPAKKEDNLVAARKWLNANYGPQLKKYCGGLLAESGKYDKAMRAACLAVWKDLMNRKHGTSLTPKDTNFGPKCKAAAPKAQVAVNSAGTFTYICQTILSAEGFYTGIMDASCGAELVKATEAYQKKHGLTADGICGKNTWYQLFN